MFTELLKNKIALELDSLLKNLKHNYHIEYSDTCDLEEKFELQMNWLFRDLSDHLKDDGKKLHLYRAIKVEREDFFEKLKESRFLKEYNGLGVHWTYEKSKASVDYEPGAHGDTTIILHALVDYESVNLDSTLSHLLDPTFSFEKEITLYRGAELELKFIEEDGHLIEPKLKILRS